MQLNGKKFKITAQVKLELIEEIEQNPDIGKDKMFEFVKQVLKPTPSAEDLAELNFEQYLDIFYGFKKAIEKKYSDIKKKLSQ